MELILLDSDFQTLQIIDNYESLIWYRKYGKIGEFSLYVGSDYYEVIKAAAYIYINSGKELAVIEQFEIEGTRCSVRGRFYETKLGDKVIYPTLDFYNQSPETIVYSILGQYFPDISIPAPTGMGSLMTTQYTGKTVLEAILDICSQQELGFLLTYDYKNDQLKFSLYQGKDRRQTQNENGFIIFSENYENLLAYKYNYSDKDTKNFAYVAGQGEDDGRVVVQVDVSGGKQHREMWVDARDLSQDGGMTLAQYQQILTQRGLEKLIEFLPIENIECTPNNSAYVYQVDYDLGDLCSIEIKELGLSLEERIQEVTEVYEGETKDIEITLGNQYPVIKNTT